MFFIWALAFSVVGMILIGNWIRAYNLCREEQKWIMATPIWMFMPSCYLKDGKEIRNCSLICIAFSIVLGVLFVGGWVTKS